MKKHSLILFPLLSFSSLSVAHETGDLEHEEQLSDLVVQADLRDDTKARNVATSLTVLDDETLSKAGVQHFQDVLGLTPNINWAGSTSRPRYFQIRGIGERSQYEGAPNPSVGFIIDDMDFTGIGGVATLFDMEQIEVLRGPQGTRYGANALAGMIYAQSKAPSFVSEHSLEATLADHGTSGLGFSSTGRLGDLENVNYRLTAHQYKSDGFRKNTFFNRDDTDDKNELMTRGKIQWYLHDNWQLNATFLLVDIDNGFDVWNPENTLTTHSNDLGIDNQRSVGLSLKNTWSNDRFDIVSISSHTDSDIQYFFDGDWGNDDYWGELGPYDFTSNNNRERSNLTQEIRLISNKGSRIFNDSTEWLAGLYFSDLSEDNAIDEFYNGAVYRQLDSEFTANTWAIFGQLDTHITDKTTLTTGLRFEQRDSEYTDSNGLSLKPEDDMFGGQISLKHQLNKQQNIYATISRGYKAGGFNLSVDLPEARRAYDPEYLINYEIGLKSMLLDYRLSLNVSAFYSERKDMQISTSFQSDPTDPLTFIFFTGNAAEGTNQGLEMDWVFQATRNWSFHGALGLLDATFSDYVTAEDNFNGRKQAHAPDYNYNVGFTFESDFGWFARADLNGSDGFYFSNSHDQKAKSRQLLNLKVGYQTYNWSVALWGRNVLDEEYAVRGFYFGLEPPNYENTLYKHLGDPQHFGVTAKYNF